MAKGSGLLERQTAASAPGKLGARRRCANRDRALPGTVKLPQTDQFLEDTLTRGKLACSLTKRETEILNLILTGQTNKKIAQKLFRSERTIEYHRHRLMNKVGAKTAADLVKRAITMGLV
ncbi:MAG: response regulator transcription factor [Planctomycetes bacterium]|nr:response regulator transcription factor [Planctomycetota bacterium]